MVKDSFAKGFKLANKSFPLVLIFIIVSSVINLATSPLTKKIQTTTAPYFGPNPEKMDWAVISTILPALMAVFLINFVVNAYFRGGFWGYVSESVEKGRGSVKFFIKAAFTFFPRMVGLVLFSFVVSLAAFIAVSLSGIPFFVLAALMKSVTVLAGILAILGVLAMIAAAVFASYFMIRFFGLAAMIAVAQNKKIFEAVKQSNAFLKKYFWPFVGLSLLYMVIYLLVVGAVFLVGKTSAPQAVQVALGLVFGVILVYTSIAARTSFLDFYLTQNNTSAEKSAKA